MDDAVENSASARRWAYTPMHKVEPWERGRPACNCCHCLPVVACGPGWAGGTPALSAGFPKQFLDEPEPDKEQTDLRDR